MMALITNPSTSDAAGSHRSKSNVRLSHDVSIKTDKTPAFQVLRSPSKPSAPPPPHGQRVHELPPHWSQGQADQILQDVSQASCDDCHATVCEKCGAEINVYCVEEPDCRCNGCTECFEYGGNCETCGYVCNMRRLLRPLVSRKLCLCPGDDAKEGLQGLIDLVF